MKKETLIWLIVFLLGAGWLGYRASQTGMGSTYMKAVDKEFVNVGTAEDPNWINYNSDDVLDYDVAEVPYADIPEDQRISWVKYDKAMQREYVEAERADPDQTTYQWSFWRTLGTWLAAFFTLAIFSFLYKDNPLYKIAEACVVGVSAAYWMVVGFWDMIIPNLVAKLAPGVVKAWSTPELDSNPEYLYIVPLILGIMLLWRLAPKGAWIARWPLAFIIGSTAGFRMIAFLQGDFVSQIRNGIVPLYATVVDPATGAAAFDFWASIRNIILVGGVLACLVYFFFSFEHKGAVGKTARVGIWVLMVTFGAAFGYTVMGRIALLAIRFEFLFDDWLWLIDPKETRIVGLLHYGLVSCGLL